MNAFPLKKGDTYWLRNPRLGTHAAVQVLLSPNQRGLAFQLKSPLLSRVGGGVAYQPNIPLLYDPRRGYVDFFTDEPWELLQHAPGLEKPGAVDSIGE